MPKMKTKSSAKKRFRVRPGGTVKRGQAFKRHILTKKTTKNKRHLRGAVTVHETNMGHMAQMLPGHGHLINDEQGANTCLASNVVSRLAPDTKKFWLWPKVSAAAAATSSASPSRR